MHPLRTRFAKDIVAEFFPPYFGRRKTKHCKVIIVCGGMPGHPGKLSTLLEFFSRKGYWAFNPRYRGSWESGGSFLKVSPEKDVRDVIDGLATGFNEIRSGRRYTLAKASIVLIGGSFGGPAVLPFTNDKRVRGVITFAPVVDWRSPSREEPIEIFYDILKAEFGEGYRVRRHDWDKLKTGKFYNPIAYAKDVNGAKVLMFHAKDDAVVSASSVKRFAKISGAKLVLRTRGGHLRMAGLVKSGFWKVAKKFIGSTNPKITISKAVKAPNWKL